MIIVYYKCLQKANACFEKYAKEEREENIFRVETYINDKQFYKELAILIENKKIELLDIV